MSYTKRLASIKTLVKDAVGTNKVLGDVAWNFINTDDFDALCEGTGVDPNIARQLVRETRAQTRKT